MVTGRHYWCDETYSSYCKHSVSVELPRRGPKSRENTVITAGSVRLGTVILDAYKTDGSVYSVPSAQLKLGTTYILRELSAQRWSFKKADDIIFTVNDNGSITRADNVKVVRI